MKSREELARLQKIFDRMMSDTREVATVEDVQEWIEEIRTHEYDHIQHPAEDALHRSVLRAIANGTAVDGVAMATLALTTWTDIQFARWYD